MRHWALIAGLFATMVFGLAGCASGPRAAGRGEVGETFVVRPEGESVRVLNPGSVTVATNGAMPTLRVEAFRSEERKP